MYFSHTNFCLGPVTYFGDGTFGQSDVMLWKDEGPLNSPRPRVKYMQGSCNKHKDINTYL